MDIFGTKKDETLNGTAAGDTIRGGGGADRLLGLAGDDDLYGDAGTDRLEGGEGNDTLTGGEGADYLDGGQGVDVAVFSGARADYEIVSLADGSLTVADLRPGKPDGKDRLVSIERLVFSDQTHDLVSITEGKVADGYIAGATVFMDANNNGLLDSGEASTTTDADGDFTLAGSGPIVAFGGTNIDTGLANTVTLKAPEGSTVVNPLTTLIIALMETGLSQEDANLSVAGQFSSVADLTNYDPLAALAFDPADATALAAQKTAATIATYLSIAESFGLSEDSAIGVLAVHWGSDLTSTANVQSLLLEAGLTTDVSYAAAAIAEQNQLISFATNLTQIALGQTGSVDPNILRTTLGHHLIEASGTKTIYLSSGADTLLLAAGGDYTIWGLDNLDVMNLGDPNFIFGANNPGDPYAMWNQFNSYVVNTMNDYGGHLFDDLGRPYIVVRFPTADHSVSTTLRIMGVTVEQVNLITQGQGEFDQFFAVDYAYYPTRVTTVTSTNYFIQAYGKSDFIDIYGSNGVIDLSAGGQDRVVLRVDDQTNPLGDLQLYGFDPLTGDVLDLADSALAANGFDLFWDALLASGEEGQDAQGNTYFSFDAGTAEVYLMGVTAAEFQAEYHSADVWGF